MPGVSREAVHSPDPARRPQGPLGRDSVVGDSGSAGSFTLLALREAPPRAPTEPEVGVGSRVLRDSCGHRHSPTALAGLARAPWSSTGAATTPKARLYSPPHAAPQKLVPAGHLSKGLGVEFVLRRVAWRSLTLTKAWQGAGEDRGAA